MLTASGLLSIGAALLAATVCSAAFTNGASPYFPPTNTVGHCMDPSVQNFSLYYEALEASPQMPAQLGALRVGIPFQVLVPFFNEPQYWPVWNHLFGTNYVTNYTPCAHFDNVSYTNPPPVQPPFPVGMTAPHWIDQHGLSIDGSTFAFGWIFQLRDANGQMIVFGRHTFAIRSYTDQSGVNASIVESFEKAAGTQLDTAVNQVAWTLALQESLADSVAGFQCLELVYVTNGYLGIADVQAACGPKGTLLRKRK